MSGLNALGLTSRVRSALENAEVKTVDQLLKASKDDLLKANLSETDIKTAKLRAAKSFGLQFIPALGTREAPATRCLSVGCPTMDEFLRGGIAVRGVTEVAGESGSGKTQLCLQLSLMVQYPLACGGLQGGAVYVCTEGAFPSVRLQELTQTFTSTKNNTLDNYETDPNKVGDKIFIEHIGDAESLKQCLTSRLPQLLRQNCVRLLVVDSVAGVFRGDYEPGSGASRARDLQAIGAQLHHLADEFDMAVVCVNQVTDVPSERLDGGTGRTVAALGLSWANVVTTRLQLSRLTQRIRKMEVIFSPNLPSTTCPYEITKHGVAAICL